MRDLELFLDFCKKNSSIEGVVITGSYGRGDNDLFSDLDMVVFLNRPINSFHEGKSTQGEIQFDIRFVFLADMKSVVWSMPMFFAYIHGLIVFDRFGYISELISAKKIEWKERCFVFLCLLFASISFNFPLLFPWRGLGGTTHFDRFLKRGDLLSVQRLLQKTYENLLEATYLVNRQPCPDYKNMLRCLRMLTWFPQELLDYGYHFSDFSQLSEVAILKQKKELDCIYEKIRIKAEEEFYLPENIYIFHLTHRYVT